MNDGWSGIINIRKVFKTVYISGILIKDNPDIATDGVVGTIPEEFRPSEIIITCIMADLGYCYRTNIDTNGKISLQHKLSSKYSTICVCYIQ